MSRAAGAAMFVAGPAMAAGVVGYWLSPPDYHLAFTALSAMLSLVVASAGVLRPLQLPTCKRCAYFGLLLLASFFVVRWCCVVRSRDPTYRQRPVLFPLWQPASLKAELTNSTRRGLIDTSGPDGATAQLESLAGVPEAITWTALLMLALFESAVGLLTAGIVGLRVSVAPQPADGEPQPGESMATTAPPAVRMQLVQLLSQLTEAQFGQLRTLLPADVRAEVDDHGGVTNRVSQLINAVEGLGRLGIRGLLELAVALFPTITEFAELRALCDGDAEAPRDHTK